MHILADRGQLVRIDLPGFKAAFWAIPNLSPIVHLRMESDTIESSFDR